MELTKNPDILHFVANTKDRPQFVVGFAAEDQNLKEYAAKKLCQKNCDLIVANNIKLSKEKSVFGGDETKVFFIEKNITKSLTKPLIEDLGQISKKELAALLAKKLFKFFRQKK